jgi:hypothetical protein
MARKNIYVIAATFRDKHILRFAVCSRMTESRDIVFAWEEIRSQADQVLQDNKADSDTLLHVSKTDNHVKCKGIRKECPSSELEVKAITNGQA